MQTFYHAIMFIITCLYLVKYFYLHWFLIERVMFYIKWWNEMTATAFKLMNCLRKIYEKLKRILKTFN